MRSTQCNANEYSSDPVELVSKGENKSEGNLELLAKEVVSPEWDSTMHFNWQMLPECVR